MPVIVITSRDNVQTYVLEEGKPLFLGRSGDCDVVLPSAAVSRRHAVILYRGGVCGIKDLGSFNGTTVNDEVITESREFTDEDVVKISTYGIRLFSKDPDTAVSEKAGERKKDSNSDIRGGKPAGKMKMPGFAPVHDVSEFEESPLAQLDSIDQFETVDPTPFLASAEYADAWGEFVASLPSQAEMVIPLESDEINPNTGQSPAAEAVIPLLDALDDAAHDSAFADERGSDGRFTRIQRARPSSDTGVYTLSLAAEDADDDGEWAGGDASGDTDELEKISEESDSADTEKKPDDGGAYSSGKKGSAGTFEIDFNGKPFRHDDTSITIPPDLMAAINVRLGLYALLGDLMEERGRFRNENPMLPEDVEEELKRQDAEFDNLPSTEEVERLMQGLDERNAHLEQAVSKVGEAGAFSPLRPTREMVFAEQLAVTQWTLIRESNLQALPSIFKKAYTVTEKEPFARELKAAGIRHGRLMGGAVYLLALEVLAGVAARKRYRIANALRAMPGPDEVVGALEEKEKIKRKRERFEAEEAANEIRIEHINREAVFIERMQIREFRQIYKKVALKFIPDFESMSVHVRAFLRHGVIGFAPWWMTKETRELIVRDCSGNVVSELSHRSASTNVLYADEYLHSVSLLECTQSPDSDLDNASSSSVECKTDRAFRRIVNARSYNTRMEEMLARQRDIARELQREADTQEGRLGAIKQRGFTQSRNMLELFGALQNLHERQKRVDENIRRIESELIPSILDAMEGAEKLFRTGSLKIPDQDMLIAREVDALFRCSQFLEQGRGRFLPMVVREHYGANADKVNDRKTVRNTLAAIEELDPGIFVRTIIPARNKFDRVHLRMSPTVLIFPAAGSACFCSMEREGMEAGHLMVPACFIRRDRLMPEMTRMLADFRWDTSASMTGHEAVRTEVLSQVFTQIRRDARKLSALSKEKRLLSDDMDDRENWRTVYEFYLSDAPNGGRTFFQRNPELYETLIGKYYRSEDK